MALWLERLGHSKVVMVTDTKVPMGSMAKQVFLRAVPHGSSASNGKAEQTVQLIASSVRTMLWDMQISENVLPEDRVLEAQKVRVATLCHTPLGECFHHEGCPTLTNSRVVTKRRPCKVCCRDLLGCEGYDTPSNIPAAANSWADLGGNSSPTGCVH
eukprot:5713823-Amphidinium_carterae.2